VNLGDVVGATLGVSVDIGVAIRTDGMNLKVLGTGIDFSQIKGCGVSFFGSCLHLDLTSPWLGMV